MPVQRLIAILLALAALLLPRLAFAASYAARAEPYNWISTAGHSNASWGGGCSGPKASVDDDITAELPLGFSFTFGGAAYTTARIMSNGRLQFGNTYCGNGTAVTTPRSYPLNYPDANVVRTMRIYGADFDPSLGGTVTYKATGSSPNRQFVVTWTNIQEWGASGSRFNLQIVLNENGEFVYQFGAATNVSGGKAQIGWALSTTDYGTYTFSSIGALASTAIRWGPPKSVLSGTVFEDVNYGGGAGRSLATAGGAVISGATVELYNSSGAFVSSTSTNASGTYSFTVTTAGTYHVRVASTTVRSTRSGGSSAVPVMTYRATGTTGSAVAQTDFVGGTNPAAADPGTASSGASFNTSTYVFGAGLSGTAHAVAPVTPALGIDVAGLDFGFNFDTVTNVNDSGQGSLRQAITNANMLGSDNALAQVGRAAGVETLIFMIGNGTAAAGLRSAINLTSGGVASIAVASALPSVTDPLVIDGSSQPGYGSGGSVPLVEINGAATSAGIAGLVMAADNCGVKALVINRFGGNGITLSSGGSGHVVSGNYIGTNSAGNAASPNGGHGVEVRGSGSTIGGTAAGAGNLLSGNTGSGVYVAASSTTVTGNRIGTDAAGSAAVANQYGVRVLSASSLTLGGTTSAAANTISGNSGHGVYFEGGNSGATVQGNRIGRNSTNTGAVGNGGSGVHVFNSAAVLGLTGGMIGGTAAGAGNTIAGNGGNGVSLAAGQAAQVAILGNSIHGNGGIGIDLGANGITLNNGGKASGQPNLLMDHPVLTAASLSGSTLTVSGYVGSAAGQATFANSRVEIFVSDNAQANGSGQTYLGFVTADSSGNFSGNLSVNGVTLTNGSSRLTGTATDDNNNTSEFGPNLLLGLSLSGTVFEDLAYGGGPGRSRAASGGAAVAGARVELYGSTGDFVSSTTTAPDGSWRFSGLGAAAWHVRVVTASVLSTRSGATSSLVPVPTYLTSAPAGTATPVSDGVGGTNPALPDAGNAGSGTTFNTGTYVFSAGLSGTAQAVVPVTLSTASVSGIDFGFNFDTVTNTNDSGAGSLRQVITNANALGGDAALAVSGRTAGIEHVVFMISNGSSGAGGSLGLAAGGLRSALTQFNDGVGTVSPASALPAVSGSLVLDARTQPGWASTPVVVISGLSAGAGATGLSLTAGSSTVAGLAINGFGGHGLAISGGSGHAVVANHIGLNAAGTATTANGGDGISVTGATGVAIGGGVAGMGNVISGYGGNAVTLSSSSGHSVLGNTIGLNAARTAQLLPSGHAIVISSTSSTVVGGVAAGSGNTISVATGRGVTVTGATATGNTIRGNAIHGSTGLGIDLGADGATANDGAKTASQPNLRMDKPVLSAATLGSSTLSVVGWVGSAALQATFGAALVDVYLGDGSNPAGKTWVGTLTANASGEFAGVLTTTGLSGLVAGTTRVTATATDAAGNTSEFAAHVATTTLAALQNGGFEAGVNAGTTYVTRTAGDSAGVPPWVVTGNSIEIIGGYWQHAEGVRSLDMSGNSRGGVAQVVQTVAGQPYALRFALATNMGCGTATKVLRVSAVGSGQTTSQTYSIATSGRSYPAMGWQDQVLSFTAASDATVLWFESLENSACGPALDNVRLGGGGVGSVAGTVFEDVNYGGGAGRNRVTSLAAGGTARPNARVELYVVGGSTATYFATTTTDSTGAYQFNGLPAGSYLVRVQSSSVTSSRSGAVSSLLPVATFMTDAGGGTAVERTDMVGGPAPTATAAATVAGTTGSTFALPVTSAEATSSVTVAGEAVTGVDFGFNFGTVTNTNDSGAGSLRQVIANANTLGGDAALAVNGRTAGIEHVIFMLGNGSSAPGLRSAVNLFSGGVATIRPGSALPALTSALVIDAQQQPGWVSTPVLQLSGGSAGAGVDGLTLSSATGSTVRGLAINGFSRFGLSLTAGSGHRVAGNHVGTDAAGSAAAGNGTVGVNLWTVAGSTIGGSTAADRNVIAGNGNSGIVIGGAGGTGNLVRGNHIGVNAAGSARLPNGAQGVYLASAGNQLIGNVISGNTWENVLLDLGANGSLLTANTIGLDASGSTALANGGSGLKVMSSGNVIGGTTAALRNVIAGNGGDGILISGVAASANAVQGNVIGVNAAGTGIVPNSGAGVRLQADAGGNTVGGPGAGNLIRGNAAAGVVLTGTGSNRISRNAIWGNGQIGIDLADNGVNTNDGAKTAGQPNQLMDSAVITSARVRGNQLTLSGHVGSAAGQSLFAAATVEVFVSDNHSSGHGSGQSWLGTLTADGSGAFSGTLTMPLATLAAGTRLTATATDASGNTSEFGRTFSALVVDFVVNTTADDDDTAVGDGQCLTAAGLCSLRAAITELNAGPAPAVAPTIAFALPGCTTAGQAACSIAPVTVLPTVARAMAIDASTQPGWNSSTATPLVELSGATAPANAIGLVVNTGGFSLRGLVVNRWGSHGLSLGGSGNVVAGNWFGVNASGTAAAANGGHGVNVTGSANVIGGSTPADRNVASGNGGAGIALSGSGNSVKGNYAGLLPDGNGTAANAGDGIHLSAANQTIGGSAAGDGNVASGNLRSGVRLDVGADGSLLLGNCIGVAADCRTARGNGFAVGSPSSGVGLMGGGGSRIGGTGPGEGNVIAHSASAGVGFGAVVQQVSILGNSIHGNAGEGIRLNISDANDGVYNNGQSNRGIDNPVIAGAGIDSAGTTLTLFGAIGTGTGQAAFAGARVEFFKAAPDASGHGEGQVYLGALTADGNGVFSGSISVAAGQVTVGDAITATATDGSGNTSEFGPNWTTTTLAGLSPAGFNAFDTDTVAGAISGVLRSKVAGAAATLAVVALDSSGTRLHAGFTGDVSLSWLDARDDSGTLGGSCRSSWKLLAAAGTASFKSASRITVSVTPPPSGTRAMRLKMSATVGPTTVEACSTDAFAALPARLTLVASDDSSSSAGTTRTLDTTSASGGAVHQAGRPFTVVSRALDATGALMTGYSGTPTLAPVACLLPAGCGLGALTSPAASATAGVVTNNGVSYAEVGVLSLQLTDADYAAVDSADTPATARTVQSAVVAVGRFVPDSLSVTVSAAGTLATANGACMADGQGATFVGQGFGWASAPQVTVTARNAAGGTTRLWTGPLMKLTGAAQLPALAAASAGTAVLATSFGGIGVTDLGAGQARLDVTGSDRFLLELPAGTVQPTVTPTWTWSLTVSDASEAALGGNPLLSAQATQTPVPFDRGAAFHSGRLALSAAHGDARMGVRSLLQLQRWTTAGWVTLTEDRGCVTVQPQHLGVESPSGVFSTSGDCVAPMTAAATTRGGRAWLSLPATPGAAPGRLALRLAGAGASGHSCTAAGASAGLVALAQPWLLGGATGTGPVAMATWGLPNRDLVLRRETW